MQQGFNQVILTGRLAQDPEVRDMGGDFGKAVTLSVVTSVVWKDKATGERKEQPQFHRVTGTGHTANFAESYLKKGQLVQVVGMLTHRKYQNQEGKDTFISEVSINTMEGGSLQSLGRNENATATGGAPQQQAPQQQAPQQQAPQQAAPQQAPQQQAPVEPNIPPVDGDDDIPF